MANDTETLADIVAQMRNPEGMGYTVGNTANGADISVATAICVAIFADRIEAAWERERVEIASRAATQGVKLTDEKWRSELREALTPWVSLAEWLIENAGKEALGRGIAEIVPTLRKRIDESKSALATTEGGAA